MKFKEFIDSEKPREKLKTLGVSYLSDTELLAILLRTGSKNESIIELSNRLLKEVGSLNKLKNISLNGLIKIKGIKMAKASSLVAAIELGKRAFCEEEKVMHLDSPKKIFNYYKSEFNGELQEKFFVLLYDSKLCLIKRIEVFRGTLNEISVHPREVFKNAIVESASFIVIMHNHPSGDTTPSDKDIEFTNRIISTGKIVGIEVIDHIIISFSEYYSFMENSPKS